MSTYIVMFLTSGCMFLIIYHHFLYPMLMKWLTSRKPKQTALANNRAFRAKAGDAELPTITAVVPAYNEQTWIADKIRNLANLDYPSNKFNVLILCDGCSDNTVDIARDTIQEAICSDIRIEVIEHKVNRGKLAILNEAIPNINSDLVVLTDVSTLVSLDSLLLVAQRFVDANIGVVNSKYCVPSEGKNGETSYWDYQNQISLGEAQLGAPVGAHGAFYAIRRALFQPLSPDTINDDFMLPMEIVKQGYSIAYEPNLIALEQESTQLKEDFVRRVRISAGNMQQALRLIGLFNPARPAVAFTFFSGKGLRLLTPYLVIASCIGCTYLHDQTFFSVALIAQLAVILTAGFATLFSQFFSGKVSVCLRCLFTGHAANLIGSVRYLLGKSETKWTKVNQ